MELLIEPDNKSHNSEQALNRLKIYEELGLKVAYYRKQEGMTQVDLSSRIGVSRTYISNIESPRCVPNPTLDVILDISDALHIDIMQLFDSGKV